MRPHWGVSVIKEPTDAPACLHVTRTYRTVEEMALLFSQKVTRRMIEALKEN